MEQCLNRLVLKSMALMYYKHLFLAYFLITVEIKSVAYIFYKTFLAIIPKNNSNMKKIYAYTIETGQKICYYIKR